MFEKNCKHCGQPIPRALLDASETDFCCTGCHMVFQFLSQNGLNRYYELKDQLPSFSQAFPISQTQETFAYLDQMPTLPTIQFYLEGVHCAACIWLIEKVPQLLPGVTSSTLELGKNRATFDVTPNLKRSDLAQLLQNLGYRPHLIEGNNAMSTLRTKEDRRLLIQLGIAGAIAGNIMIFSVGLYTGATGTVAEFFRWICFLLALPVIFYSAIPFYKASLAAIRLRTISMDVPVSLAVILGSLISTWHLITGEPHIYFDCIALLVFLLLSTRYFLRRITFWAVDSSSLVGYLVPKYCLKVNPVTGDTDTVLSTKIISGDIVRVLENCPIPIDGQIVKGKSWINMAAMTGETEPQPVQEESLVYCGTVNGSGILDIRVETVGALTRIGKLLSDIEAQPKAHFVTLADRFARYLLYAVGIISIGLIGYFVFLGQLSIGLNRALALMVITCPCALAIATPLSFSIAMKRAASRGILIKNADCIEKVNAIKTVIFDKTGTLTYGNLDVTDWKEESDCPPFIKPVVFALEGISHHPAAHAIRRYLLSEKDESIRIDNPEEHLGKGVSGYYRGYLIRVIKGQEGINVSCDNVRVATITLSDQVRPDTPTILSLFREAGYKTLLASGDVQKTVLDMGNMLHFEEDELFANSSPEFKKELVSRCDHVLMVGDGANDAAALSKADIGIAVHGSLEVSMRASDVYMLSTGIAPVWQFLQESQLAIQLIKLNLVVSFIYNALFISLSILGYVSPLVAAIVMPASSLLVVMISLTAYLKKI